MRSRIIASEEERRAVCSIRREAQQLVRCWGCGEEGHYLWTCPKKVACPVQGKAQQRRLKCIECKEENHVAKNCDSYWRWREQELRRKLRELKGKVKRGGKSAEAHSVASKRDLGKSRNGKDRYA